MFIICLRVGNQLQDSILDISSTVCGDRNVAPPFTMEYDLEKVDHKYVLKVFPEIIESIMHFIARFSFIVLACCPFCLLSFAPVGV
jgi:hypothetical protein